MGRKSASKKKNPVENKKDQRSARSSLSPWKAFFFSVLSVSVAVILLEGSLSLLGYRPFVASDPYVGFQSQMPLFVLDKDGNTFKTAKNKLNHFNRQSFSAKKRENGYRIFTLGGSTTYGRPYFDSTSFSGWLREFLKGADPDRDWEVINCGGVSYASYRAAALMEELIRYDPDLFIVYSGHNEFLERRTYSGIIEEPQAVTQLKLFLGNLRTYSFLTDIKEKLVENNANQKKKAGRLAGEVDALLNNSAGPDIYHRDDELQKQVLSHYRFNLNRMVELAKSRDAEIIFVTTPVNLKDFTPFKSEHRETLPKNLFEDYENELSAASKAIHAGRLREAAENLNTLAKRDDRYALTRYDRGRALLGMAKFSEAKREFMKAVDEDVCPLRALSPMDKIVEETASRNNVPLVHFTRILESICLKKFGHPIPGKEYFLDHVHPTIEAHRILGLELLNTLIGLGVVKPRTDWSQASVDAIIEKVESGIDAKAHAHAEKILARVLIWAGKKKEAARFAKSAAKELGDDAESQFHRAFSLEEEEKFEEAIAGYRRAIEINPDYLLAYSNLTLLLGKTKKRVEALKILESLIKKYPGDPRFFNNYGVILYDEKRFEEAIQNFEKSLKLDPGNAKTHSNMGLAYSALSLFKSAIKSLNRSLKLEPADTETRRLIGLAYAASGEFQKALFHFEEVLRRDPGNSRIQDYITRCKQELAR